MYHDLYADDTAIYSVDANPVVLSGREERDLRRMQTGSALMG